MPVEDFQIQEVIGKGSFSSVCKCLRKSDTQTYAMKRIKIHKLKSKDKQNALNEIRILASIRCPFIVAYKEAFYDENSQELCIIMEYAHDGDLQAKIKKAITVKKKIPEEDIWKVAYCVLQGLAQLHQANILHRDIKPANIFYHDSLPKIGDLNVAKHLKDEFTVTQTGTPYYASPQVWSQEPYNFSCDVWSLGCVLYEMSNLQPPFRAENPQRLYKKIMSGQYQRVNTYYSKQLSVFISSMLNKNQKQRASVKQLLNEPRILELKKELEGNWELEKELLQTIKFPQSIKLLNEQLPKPMYSKTTKNIPDESDSVGKEPLKMAFSTKKIPILNPKINLAKEFYGVKPPLIGKCRSQKLLI